MDAPASTIFIIDDDESVRRALHRLIKSIGWNAETFASAEEFLEASGTPHCLVLDVHLPGMSGLELQERLKVEGRGIPIVFITAYPIGLDRKQAFQAGAIAFLDKPFEEQAFVAALVRAMAESQARGV